MTEGIPKYFRSETTDRFINFLRENGEMMIQMEMEFEHRLDDDRLAKALDLTLDAEPILGCRFVPQWWRPHWEELGKEDRAVLTIAKDADEYEVFKSASIDTCTGPQIKVILLHAVGSDRLLLKVTHDVTDAAGVKQIAAIVSSVYSKLSADPEYRPEPKVSGSRSSWQVLRYIPWHAYPGILFHYYVRLWPSRVFPIKSGNLPVIVGKRGSLEIANRKIPVDLVNRLAEYRQQHKVTLNDVILASFINAVTSASNRDRRSYLRMVVTVDLRRYMPDEYADGICNLSGVEMFIMKTDSNNSFDLTLARVASFMRWRKERWIGISDYIGLQPVQSIFPYGPMKRVVPRVMRFFMDRGNAPCCFTNMGAIDTSKVSFDMPPVEASLLPPVNYPPSVICCFSSYNGSLTISAGAWSTQKEQIERLFDEMILVLSGLVPCKANVTL